MTNPASVLWALMVHNGLGHSGNKRSIQAGAVKVNGHVITDPDTAIKAGDAITVGRNYTFRVDKLATTG